MISFTAGSKYFLTRSSIYEDTGEFIGGLIHSYCPELAEYIKRLLDEAEDPISLLLNQSQRVLCRYLRKVDMRIYQPLSHKMKL